MKGKDVRILMFQIPINADIPSAEPLKTKPNQAQRCIGV